MILCGQETVRTFFAEARMVGVKYRKIRYPCATFALPIYSLLSAYPQRVVTEWYRGREGECETETQNLDNSKKNRTFACEIHVHDAMGYLQIAHC